MEVNNKDLQSLSVANPFETGERKVIPAVLIYLRKGDTVLMLHRCLDQRPGKEKDFHQGRWNGIGGKFEVNESPLEAARRETREETGIDLELSRFEVQGVVFFPLFKPKKKEDWLVYVLTVDLSSQEPLPDPLLSPEGELHWVLTTDVLGLNLWPGDRKFLPLVLERKSFFGTLWYEDGEVIRDEIQRHGSSHD